MAAAAAGCDGRIDVLYVIVIIITVRVYSCCGRNRKRKKRNLEVYNGAALAWTDGYTRVGASWRLARLWGGGGENALARIDIVNKLPRF